MGWTSQGCFSRACVFYTFIISYFCTAVNCGYLSIRQVCRKSADCGLRALWTRWARLWTSLSKHRLTSAKSTRLWFSQELGLYLLGTVKTWWITASIAHVLPTDITLRTMIEHIKRSETAVSSPTNVHTCTCDLWVTLHNSFYLFLHMVTFITLCHFDQSIIACITCL